MKKKKKKKRSRNRNNASTTSTGSGQAGSVHRSGEKSASGENIVPPDGITWMEGDGVHALLPGEKPSEEQIQKITEAYQRQIRKSPLFKQWVKQFGKKKAVEMLRECRFEVR